MFSNRTLGEEKKTQGLFQHQIRKIDWETETNAASIVDKTQAKMSHLGTRYSLFTVLLLDTSDLAS